VAIRPVVDELAAREGEGAVVRFRPGSPGEKAAPGVAAGVRRARRRLAGLGSEPWGTRPQICLVDPFPDPDHPGEVITSGTVVDAAARRDLDGPSRPRLRPRSSSDRSPSTSAPRSPPRATSGCCWRATAPRRRRARRRSAAPRNPAAPLVAAEGELASAMARSFVAYLLERGSEVDFRRLLSSAQRAGSTRPRTRFTAPGSACWRTPGAGASLRGRPT